MVSGIINLTSNHSRMEGRIVWEASSNGSVSNTSTVTAHLQVRKNDGYESWGDWTGTLSVGETSENFATGGNYKVNNDWNTLKSIIATVGHNSSGAGSCYIYGLINGPANTSLSGYKCEGSQTISLEVIPRYASFLEHYIKSIGLNNVTVYSRADSSIDRVQYSLNGGAWTDTSGLTYTVYGLSPSTNYNIRTRMRRADSGLWTESGYDYFTTKDIAKILNVVNFEHGNDAVVGVTNSARY